MGVGDEEAGDEIVLARGHARATLAAAALGAIGRHRHALDVAAVRDRDHHVLALDQVLDVLLELVVEDVRAARRGELGLDLEQFVAHQREQLVAIAQQLEISFDQLGHLSQLLGDLVAFETGEALQPQLEDGASLDFGELVGALGGDLAPGLGDQGDQRRHIGRRPVLGHQPLAGHDRIGRAADQFDHLVDVGDGNGEADQHVRAIAGMVQLELGASGDDLGTEADERLQQFLEVHQARPAAIERQRIHAERGLQRREAIELVQHHVGHGVALQLDHQAHAVAIAFVANLRDAFDFLVANHFGDPLVQPRLVFLVRNFRDDDRFAAAAAFLDLGARPHDDRAAPEFEGRANAIAAQDGGARREIGSRHVFHDLRDGEFGIIDQGAAGIDQLAEIVRRNVGCHADGDAAGPVGQQVRERGRQDRRLLFALVVVGLEVDRVLVDIGEQRLRRARQTRFGVAHCRRRIAIHRAEIALPRNQWQTHGEILRHADHRVVNRGVAVWVILAHHVAHDTRGLAERLGRVVAAFLHREEHATVNGLQPVARIGQSARHDHAHRVIEIGALHLLFDIDRRNVVRRLGRRRSVRRRWRRRREDRIVAHEIPGFWLVFCGSAGGPAERCRTLPAWPGNTNKKRSGNKPLTI